MSRVILVDNESNILSVLSTVLKVEGFEVVCCRDVPKAQEVMRSEPFDLLISDIRMSPLSGMDLLKWGSWRKAGYVGDYAHGVWFCRDRH
jgi:two-component system, NtrC family, response regulator PilR